MKITVSLLSLAAALLLVACKKSMQEDTSPLTEKEKMMAASAGFSEMPVISDGMMVFKDSTHIARYMSYLQKRIDDISPEDSTQDEHSVLQEIEKSQGFTSIRSISHEAFLKQDEVGWRSLKEIPEEHFILSNDVKSVLNTNLEVQVGDRITHYVNKDYVVNVDAAQRGLLDQFRKLKPDAGIEEVMEIDYLREHSSVIKLTDLGGGILKGSLNKPTGGPEQIQFPWSWAPDICNDPYTIRFEGLALRDPSYLKAYFVISYGDGTTASKSTQYVFLKGWRIPAFTHTYSSLGVKHICIKAYYAQGSALVDEECMDVNIPPNAGCLLTYKESDWKYGYVSPTRAWGGKLKIERVTPWFSSPKTRVIGITKSVEQKSNGDWHHVKGAIGVEVSCVAKNNNCVQVDHLVGGQGSNKSKEETVHRTGSGEFFWGTATSTHYLNGVPVTINLKSCQ